MADPVANAIEEFFWWLGWHPLYILSAGIVLGLIAGFIYGSIAIGVVVIGVLLILFGLYKTNFTYGITAIFAVIAAINQTVGLTQLLQIADLDPNSGPISIPAEAFINLYTTFGFASPAANEVTAASIILGGLITWHILGAVIGLLIWGVGAMVINSTYTDAYDAFNMIVRKKGEALLGEDIYTPSHGSGNVFGVKPHSEYFATNVNVGDNSLVINYGSKINMPKKEISLSESTKQMYYDQLASVDYEKPYFEVRMADGEVVNIVTNEKPEELLDEIENKLREYKSAPEPQQRQREAREPSQPETQETDEQITVGEESRERAEEAVSDMEEAIDSVLEDMGDTLEIMSGEEPGEDETSQVEVEKKEDRLN